MVNFEFLNKMVDFYIKQNLSKIQYIVCTPTQFSEYVEFGSIGISETAQIYWHTPAPTFKKTIEIQYRDHKIYIINSDDL